MLEAFERILDDDTLDIEIALDEIAAANARDEAKQLAAEVQRFAAALEAGAIVPMDF